MIGEELTLGSLKGPDGQVRKPCHYCRDCMATFGEEDVPYDPVVGMYLLLPLFFVTSFIPFFLSPSSSSFSPLIFT